MNTSEDAKHMDVENSVNSVNDTTIHENQTTNINDLEVIERKTEHIEEPKPIMEYENFGAEIK